MRIVLITDTHIGSRNDNLALTNYFKKFYDKVFFPYIKENNITNVIHLGDMFCRRKYTNHLTLYHAKQYFFDKFMENNVHVDIIVGNHDLYYKNSTHVNSPLLFLGEYLNIKTHFSATEIIIDGCKILLVPWICSENEEETIRILNATEAQVVMGHLEFQGFEMYKGSPVDHGYNTEKFDKFDVVCSGHFHHKSSRGNINYLGCPYEQTWSDFGDQKGFHIFDTETRELTFIPNPYKLFNKVEYDDSKLTVDDINNFDFEEMRDTYLKVIVKNKTNPYFFDLFMDKLEKIDPINVQIIEEKIVTESDDEIIDEAKDTLDILTDYVDSLEGFDEKKMLKELFRELYNEAIRI